MGLMSGSALSGALAALAALGAGPVPGKFANEALPRLKEVFPDLTPPELAGVLWALVRLRVRPPADWMDAYLAAVARVPAREFSSHAMSDVLWALATLRFQPADEWLAPLRAQLRGRAPELDAPVLGSVLWSLKRLELEGEVELERAFAARVGLAAARGDALERFADLLPQERRRLAVQMAAPL